MLIGFSRSGNRPVSRGAVVLLDVLARAGDRQQVEQLEVVEAEHVDQARRACARRPPRSSQRLNCSLGLADRGLDAGDAVLGERRVVALGDEGDLVLQVGQAVVDRRGRQHQDAGLDAFLDDPSHQAVVAGLARPCGVVLLRKLWDSSMTTRS